MAIEFAIRYISSPCWMTVFWLREPKPMPSFRTHITTSSCLGVVYGAVGIAMNVPITSAVIGGGLCSLAGMLPDLDSDSGVPVREITNVAAAVTPILMLDRFAAMGLGHEQMIVAAGGVYLVMRFGVARVFKNYTVHRGMWHSVPAACIAAILGFMICSCHSLPLQWYKAGAVFLGFMSHLVLDELNSFETKNGRLRIKRSFGTALKLWGRKPWANVSTYSKLVLVLLLAFGDHMYFRSFVNHNRDRIQTASEFLGGFHGRVNHDEHDADNEGAEKQDSLQIKTRETLLRR